MTGRALVVGYGNPLRGDDGVGQALAAALAKTATGTLDVIGCHQLVPELAERLATVDLAIFVDADIEGQPGSIRITRMQQSTTQHGSSLVHHVNPAALLLLSRQIYGRSPEAFIVTVAAGSLALNEGCRSRSPRRCRRWSQQYGGWCANTCGAVDQLRTESSSAPPASTN